jgi:hypothetical protein
LTACLYINPSSCPSIISDCLVSQAGLPPVTPTTILNCPDPSKVGSLSLLTSKMCHEFGDTLLSFAANDACSIFQFRGDFSDYHKLTFSQNRPNRFTASRVSEFNEHRPLQEQIQILGFAPDYSNQEQAGWAVNFICPDVAQPGLRTNNFNECFAIGSGAPQLLSKLSDFDRVASTFPDDAKKNTYALTLGLVGALNSERLFGINNFSASHWGGYFQWRGYDLNGKVWAWQPSWLHVLYYVKSGESFTNLDIYPRFVAYDSYGLWAELTVVSLFKNQPYFAKWKIENLFHPLGYEKQGRQNLDGFKAEILTLTIIYCNNGYETSVHRTLSPVEMKSVECDFTIDRFSINVPWGVLGPILSQTLSDRDYGRLSALNS